GRAHVLNVIEASRGHIDVLIEERVAGRPDVRTETQIVLCVRSFDLDRRLAATCFTERCSACWKRTVLR
ncbi:hypothetical protein C6A85_04160, partial [Mycobacterium sp. ITM-2017-0098]